MVSMAVVVVSVAMLLLLIALAPVKHARKTRLRLDILLDSLPEPRRGSV